VRFASWAGAISAILILGKTAAHAELWENYTLQNTWVMQMTRLDSGGVAAATEGYDRVSRRDELPIVLSQDLTSWNEIARIQPEDLGADLSAGQARGLAQLGDELVVGITANPRAGGTD